MRGLCVYADAVFMGISLGRGPREEPAHSLQFGSRTILHEEGVSRQDYQASEDDYVIVDGIANDPLALGFFGYAYYSENRARLKVLTVDDGNPENGAGSIVPSKDTQASARETPQSRHLHRGRAPSLPS